MLYGVSTLSSEIDCKADGHNRNQMAFFRLPLFQTDPITDSVWRWNLASIPANFKKMETLKLSALKRP